MMVVAISSSIKLQSDSTPFSVSLLRQPCNIMLPVEFVWKVTLHIGAQMLEQGAKADASEIEVYLPRQLGTCPCFLHGQAYISEVESELGPCRATFGPRPVSQFCEVDVLHRAFHRLVCRRVIGSEAECSHRSPIVPVVDFQCEIIDCPINARPGAFSAGFYHVVLYGIAVLSEAYSAEQSHERGGCAHLV